MYYYEHPGFKKLSIELHAIGYVSEPHYWMKLPRWGPSWKKYYNKSYKVIIVVIMISKLEQVQTCSHFHSESWSPTHFNWKSSLGAITIGTAIHTMPFFLSFWLLLPLIAFVIGYVLEPHYWMNKPWRGPSGKKNYNKCYKRQ